MSAWLVALVLGLLTFVLYLPTRHYAFVTLDDPYYVYANPHVAIGWTSDSLRWALTEPVAANWHPLTMLSHMLDSELYGVANPPAGHHLTNAALHAVNASLLLVALLMLGSRAWVATVVAAGFAWHPLRVESVAWISERKDLLAGMFWIATLAAYAWYVRRPGWGRYLAVVAGMVLGLLSKPMVVTLPFVLLLLDVWPLGRMRWDDVFDRQGRLRFAHRVLEKLPLFALAAAGSVVTFLVQRSQGAVEGLDAFPLPRRVAQAVIAYAEYLAMMIRPEDLAIPYPTPQALNTGELALCAGVVVLITLLVLWLRNRLPWLSVGWLWYLGTLVPVIGLVQVGTQSMADRYTYLPMIGVLWALAETLDRSIAGRRGLRVLASVCLLAMGASYYIASREQMTYWSSPQTLFARALSVTRDNGAAHLGMANELAAVGDFRAALPHYERGTQLEPRRAVGFFNYGVSLWERREALDRAVELFNRAQKLGYPHEPIDALMGAALVAQGRDEAAAPRLALALQSPETAQFPVAVAATGVMLARGGKLNEAIALYEDFLRAKYDLVIADRLAWIRATSTDDTLRNGAAALALVARGEEAPEAGNPEHLAVRAAALAENGELVPAIDVATEALRRARQLDEAQAAPRWKHLIERLRGQLERYGNRQPMRESPAQWSL
ncbi:MAG: hypothetical protein K1X74_15130 [Pirellulales bacterium]|nr:hypothetical protein [Pirellulales bacterium]